MPCKLEKKFEKEYGKVKGKRIFFSLRSKKRNLLKIKGVKGNKYLKHSIKYTTSK